MRKSPRSPVAAPGEGGRLSDLAYARVFSTVFERRIAVGAFVSQAELVQLTGVPMGPLRDALRTLEAEGILTIHPRAGIQFVKPGLELTQATYQFRSILETAAIAAFVNQASDADLRILRESHEAVAASLAQGGLTQHSHEDLEVLEEQLHGAIVASLNNPLITTSYRRIRNYLRLLRLDRTVTMPLALSSIAEHTAILKACVERDPGKAVAALQAHFTAALRRVEVSRFLARPPSEDAPVVAGLSGSPPSAE